MTPRFHTAGNYARHMTEARRNHIHGKLQSLRPEGEPSLIAGTLIVLAFFGLLALVAWVAS